MGDDEFSFSQVESEFGGMSSWIGRFWKRSGLEIKILEQTVWRQCSFVQTRWPMENISSEKKKKMLSWEGP